MKKFLIACVLTAIATVSFATTGDAHSNQSKHFSTLSKPELNKELSHQILYMYNFEEVIKTWQEMFLKQNLSPQKKACFSQTFTYPNAQTMVENRVKNYVQNQSAQQTQNELNLLIDSNYNSQMYLYSKAYLNSLISHRSLPDTTIYDNMQILSESEKSFLKETKENFAFNPTYTNFRNLLGVQQNPDKALPFVFLTSVFQQCDITNKDLKSLI